MLNAVALNASLAKAAGNGVELVLLLDASGTVISSATSTSETRTEDHAHDHAKEGGRDAAIDAQLSTTASNSSSNTYASIVAAVANIWRAYGRCDLAVNQTTYAVESDALEQVLVELEQGRRLCAMAVGSVAVVCLVTRAAQGHGPKEETKQREVPEMGMLKLRTAALQRVVYEQLRPVLTV